MYGRLARFWPLIPPPPARFLKNSGWTNSMLHPSETLERPEPRTIVLISTTHNIPNPRHPFVGPSASFRAFPLKEPPPPRPLKRAKKKTHRTHGARSPRRRVASPRAARGTRTSASGEVRVPLRPALGGRQLGAHGAADGHGATPGGLPRKRRGPGGWHRSFFGGNQDLWCIC